MPRCSARQELCFSPHPILPIFSCWADGAGDVRLGNRLRTLEACTLHERILSIHDLAYAFSDPILRTLTSLSRSFSPHHSLLPPGCDRSSFTALSPSAFCCLSNTARPGKLHSLNLHPRSLSPPESQTSIESTTNSASVNHLQSITFLSIDF